MTSFFQMDRAEFKRHVMTLAHGFAAAAYQREHPSDEDAAWAWASEHWKGFVPRALDCIALLEAVREAEEASPWN